MDCRNLSFAFLCLLLAYPLWAGETMYLRLPDKTRKEYPLKEIQGIKLSLACAEDKKACLALIADKVKNQTTQTPSDTLTGHPASAFCKSSGGKNLILEDEKFNQYDFCYFENGFGIDSWQMLKKYKK